MDNYNVKNLIVAKEKNSDFLEERINNTILKDCGIARVLPSGNYYIFTFDITHPNQREELNRIQDNWI